jgi:hypothetical protein
MNLLIVFAFAGDSTMTRFLAIAERPTQIGNAGIPRFFSLQFIPSEARDQRSNRRRLSLFVEARTIAPCESGGQNGYRM